MFFLNCLDLYFKLALCGLLRLKHFLELFLQLTDLILENTNFFTCHLQVFKSICEINLGVLDLVECYLFTPLCELESAERLLEVAVMGSERGHQDNL